MTYRELKAKLDQLNDDQLDQTATVYTYSDDEFRPVDQCLVAKDSDVLDDGHFYIEV